MTRLNAEIEDQLYDEFKTRTKQHNTKVSKVIRQLIIDWLEEHKPPDTMYAKAAKLQKAKRHARKKGITFAHRK